MGQTSYFGLLFYQFSNMPVQIMQLLAI